MQRPGKFEHNRFVGDKRTQVVYDVDELGAEHAEALPADRLDTALRDADMLLVVVPDINQQFVPVDMEIRIRRLLGIET